MQFLLKGISGKSFVSDANVFALIKFINALCTFDIFIFNDDNDIDKCNQKGYYNYIKKHISRFP